MATTLTVTIKVQVVDEMDDPSRDILDILNEKGIKSVLDLMLKAREQFEFDGVKVDE